MNTPHNDVKPCHDFYVSIFYDSPTALNYVVLRLQMFAGQRDLGFDPQ